ncbi:MAG TPA: hypothetical protein VFJ16_05105 [Longimicrobium sp.]|nr:hypothetical protein [Longimicrobium sp.]
MRLSTPTQRSEIKAAEDRRDIAVPASVIALIMAVVLAIGGHWLVALAVAAAGGFVFLNTAAELRSLGDPASAEAFYRLADPRRPLDLPAATPRNGGESDV